VEVVDNDEQQQQRALTPEEQGLISFSLSILFFSCFQ